jgi:PAS domain S-box-containing protein
MTALTHLPIRRKVLGIVLRVSGVVMLVAALAPLLFQIAFFHFNLKRDTAALATIIANNSTAALAFNDRKAAAEILGSLAAKPSILAAELLTSTGESVARFAPEGAVPAPAEFPAPGRFLLRQGCLLYSQPILVAGKSLGVLHLAADYSRPLQRLLLFYALVMAGVLLLSAALAFLLSSRLGRAITDPILALAQTARQIGERHDYTTRAQLGPRDDELGLLAGAFNQMLDRIQAQDAALSLSQQKIEALVNSISSIVWERSADGAAFTFISQQSEAILGWKPEQWLGDPAFWLNHIHPDDAASTHRAFHEALTRRQPYQLDYRMFAAHERVVWIREHGVILLDNDQPAVLRGIFQDITAQKKAEKDLARMNQKMQDISRAAGMAEVATGVLHNVGNVLNSINVSTTLVLGKLGRSETAKLAKVAEMLKLHEQDLANFLSSDPKGRQLPAYLQRLADRILREQEELKKEQAIVARNVEHVMQIVAMQQNYAKVSGVIEKVRLPALVDEVLQIFASELENRGIRVQRRYHSTQEVLLDRHKFIQILANLVRNARQALEDSPTPEKTLTVTIEPDASGRVRVAVADNGAGIAPENLARIFAHGFTTRQGGHGFGLHNSANAAGEMDASLHAHSDGLGRGAVFTLELPAASPPDSPNTPA